MPEVSKDLFLLPAPQAAPLLLGKLLCVRQPDGTVKKARITETEAYYGEEDTACHASSGRTPRTSVMYEEGGIAYVYLCYGIHEMLNVVTGPEGHPEAVLIRGAEGAPGPGRLTRLLGIGRSLNGASFLNSGRIWLEDDGFRPEYDASPRIGIGYASEEDRNRLWRFSCAKVPSDG